MGIRRFVLGAAGVAALAGISQAGVLGSEFEHMLSAEMHGDWQLTNQASLPASQAPYGFDTLIVEEHVPGYVWPNDGTSGRIDDNMGRPAERWSDLWVNVTREYEPGQGAAMIAFDKKVINWTNYHWTDFHIEIGMGLGDDFEAFDGLDFKRDPSPQEEEGLFPDPPMFGGGQGEPPSLWWDINQPYNPTTAEMGRYPGVWPEDYARFWFAITIPEEKFLQISSSDLELAGIVIRQHWTPTPGAAGLMAVAFGAVGVRRRRSN